MNNIPRPEYPRPQFVRKEWINLNGQWSYELDLSESGVDDEFLAPGYPEPIQYPGRSKGTAQIGRAHV